MREDNNMKVYEIDRAVLVTYYIDKLFILCDLTEIVKYLTLSGEFIVTVDDILKTVKYIDGKLVGLPGTKIPVEQIKVTYKR